MDPPYRKVASTPLGSTLGLHGSKYKFIEVEHVIYSFLLIKLSNIRTFLIDKFPIHTRHFPEAEEAVSDT